MGPILDKLDKHWETHSDEEMAALVSVMVTGLVYRMVVDSLSVSPADAQDLEPTDLRRQVGEQFSATRQLVEDSVVAAFEAGVKVAASHDAMYVCRIQAATAKNTMPC